MSSPSPLLAGFLGCCPRCGKGKLFYGLMSIVPHCSHCNLSFVAQDSGDGPMFFVLVVVGFLSVGLAAFTEIRFAPPLWLHALLWIPFTILASIFFLRFFKGWLIALQYKHNPDSFM